MEGEERKEIPRGEKIVEKHSEETTLGKPSIPGDADIRRGGSRGRQPSNM